MGVLRAGMIAVPLPLLWRKAEIRSALGRVGAKAIVTCCGSGRTSRPKVPCRLPPTCVQSGMFVASGTGCPMALSRSTAQCAEIPEGTLVLPAPAVPPIAKMALVDAKQTIVTLRRAPERVARRGDNGFPAPVPLGPVHAS